MAKPSITVQIILPEDTSAIKSTQKPAVRHCGDEILGYIEVMTCGTFGFNIEVAFEGLVRTWIGSESDSENPYHLPPTAELQFLKETQQVFSDPSAMVDRGHLCAYHLPFRFVIPHELVSPRANVHSNFLKLCPSAKLGLAFRGTTNGQFHRQPAIMYVIRVTRIKTGILTPDPLRSNFTREIIVMPYTPVAPPLEMEHFPQEYRSSTTKTLKQHRWGRPLGVLKISAVEPSPLNIWTSAPRPSTIAALKLAFSPLDPCQSEVRPFEWKYVAYYHLRSRTFYSTQILDRMPTTTAAKRNLFLKFRDEKIRSEVREFGTISWKRDCETRSPEHNVTAHDGECCIWTTNLAVPVSGTKVLLPTFLNQLSARQYALIIRLGIQGLYHRKIELILPVQVILYPPQGILDGIDEESRVESQDEISSSVPRLSHQFTMLNVDRQYDISPPPYD